MKYKCPLIVVENLEKSRTFYETFLGQKVIMDFGANITFEGDFALQTKVSWLEFIGKTEQDLLKKSNVFELYFEEEDFDAFLERLELSEAPLLHPCVEYSWGQRVIRFYDPDSHVIEVGESIEQVVKRYLGLGMTVVEVSAKTQMPPEFVQNCIK